MKDSNSIETVVQPFAMIQGGASRPTAERYVFDDEIARGGMGVIYRATDTVFDRKVAVKVLQNQVPADSDDARRFLDEARITALLQHPNIPAVHDFGTLADGRPFLAMKLITGVTLNQLLNDRRDPATDYGRFLATFEQVCQAVAYAHTHRILHRDLKPSNVMVGGFGEVQVLDWGLAKLIPADEGSAHETSPSPPGDWGLAKTLPVNEGPSISNPAAEPVETVVCPPTPDPRVSPSDGTQSGSIIGTPAFMPPEQAIGAIDRIDLRSDVFSLGGILAVILTGQPPFAASSTAMVLGMAANGDLADCFARLDVSGADREWIALCKLCLSPKPDDRPADARAVAATVGGLREAADERARQAEREKLSAEVRWRTTLWAAGVLVAVLLFGVAGTTFGLIRANAARRDAEAAESVAQSKQAEADAALKFIEDRVFVAARPAGWDGGIGSNLTLREAITACLPHLADDFRGHVRAEARLRLALGTTLTYLDAPQVAVQQLETALKLFTAQFGPEQADTLACMNNLAMCYGVAGRYDDAVRLNEQVLDARRRSLSPEDPLLLITQYNLACVLLASGRAAEAGDLLEQTLAVQRKVLGPDDPDLLNSKSNLGISCLLTGRRAEGEALLTEALAAQRRVAPEHPHTLRSAFFLAASYVDAGRFADALPIQREVLAVYRKILPPDYKDTLLAMVALAQSLYQTGDPAEAGRLVDEYFAKAEGRIVDPSLVLNALSLRLRMARDRKDADGCRETAEQYEKLGRTDAVSFYNAACYRAVTAGLLVGDAAAPEADRAMAWLSSAVAAGYNNRAQVENDSDLDALRGRADFRKLLESLPATNSNPPPTGSPHHGAEK